MIEVVGLVGIFILLVVCARFVVKNSEDSSYEELDVGYTHNTATLQIEQSMQQTHIDFLLEENLSLKDRVDSLELNLAHLENVVEELRLGGRI